MASEVDTSFLGSAAFADNIVRSIECPNCKNDKKFIEDWRAGDTICRECGTVLPQRIMDMGEEKRKFSDSTDDPHRTAPENPYLKDGLSTTISKDPNNAGNARMAKMQSRMINQSDRNLLAAFEKIVTIADVMGLPDSIKKKAKDIYTKFENSRTKFTRARKDGVAAAVLFMACKEEKFPRTFKEMSRETKIEEKEIRKYYSELKKLLNCSLERTSPSDLVPRIVDRLCLPYKYGIEAQKVAKKAVKYVEGKHPNSIAAACVLMVCNATAEKRYEKEIAQSATVATTTLRNVHKELLPHQAELLEDLSIARVLKES